jgi:hypothetical protein
MKLFITLAFAGMGSLLNAATITWNGSDDTDWHKQCNWNGNVVPGCTDDVIIPAAGVTNYPDVLTSKTACANSVTINLNATGALDKV